MNDCKAIVRSKYQRIGDRPFFVDRGPNRYALYLHDYWYLARILDYKRKIKKYHPDSRGKNRMRSFLKLLGSYKKFEMKQRFYYRFHFGLPRPKLSDLRLEYRNEK